jgi:outer membrane protein
MVSIWTHKEESKLSFLLQHYHNINLPYLNTTGEEYTRRLKMRKAVSKAMVVMVLGIMFCLVITTSGLAQQLKIGYVDVVRLKQEYNEYRQAEAKFQKEMEVWQAKADSMLAEMQELSDKLEKQNLMLTEQAKNEIRENLLVKQNEYQMFVDEVMGPEGQAAKKEYELSKPLIDKINTAIKLVALKGDYTYVLDSTAGSVLYADEKYDITDKVITELNK